MKAAIRKMTQRLQERIPPRRILTVNGSFFFTLSLEIPESMPATEVQDFADLHLEAQSPFPLEQLYWGLLSYPGESRILLYATPRKRLDGAGIDLGKGCVHAYPAFLTRFGTTCEKPAITFVQTERSVSALVLEAGQRVPRAVHSLLLETPAAQADGADGEPLLPTVSNEEALKARQTLLKRISSEGYEVEEGVWQLQDQAIDEGSYTYRFNFRFLSPQDELSEPVAHTLPLSRDNAWWADIREGSVIRKEKRDRQNGLWLWKGLVGAAALFAVLCLLQLFSIGFGFYNKLKQESADEQQPAAQRIESSQFLLERLENFSQRELKPFSMLNIVNQQRPASIHFSRADTLAWNQLRLDGEGRTASQVNQYIDQISASPWVESVETVRTSITGGRNVFTLLITFNTLPDHSGVELENTAQEAEPEAEAMAATER